MSLRSTKANYKRSADNWRRKSQRLEAKNTRLRAALERIAKDGCLADCGEDGVSDGQRCNPCIAWTTLAGEGEG